jgi:hypothetical protein
MFFRGRSKLRGGSNNSLTLETCLHTLSLAETGKLSWIHSPEGTFIHNTTQWDSLHLSYPTSHDKTHSYWWIRYWVSVNLNNVIVPTADDTIHAFGSLVRMTPGRSSAWRTTWRPWRWGRYATTIIYIITGWTCPKFETYSGTVLSVCAGQHNQKFEMREPRSLYSNKYSQPPHIKMLS